MAVIGPYTPEAPVWPGATPEELEAVQRVSGCVLSFERGIGVDFRERSERFYKQYRGFRQFRDAWVAAGPNDKDGLLYDATKHWGAHLHIPFSFQTIETMVPRAIAHRPRMLVMPRRPEWEDNVDAVRMLLDAQQDNINIDLAFQDVMRAGMIYGVGFGKSYWRTSYAPVRQVKRRFLRVGSQSPYVLGNRVTKKTFDDPDFEAVDGFDFMWDPYGSSIETCEWVCHRLWFGLDKCMDRIKSGAWNTPSAQALTEDKVRSMGNGQKYDEVWNERMLASGFSSFNLSTRGEQVHEIWEYHDGGQVFTVLDRQVLVQARENPCLGHLPFHAYRPTPLHKQMVGIGELEPIEHLQRELDTLRSQRRDAATQALGPGYVYDDAAIEEEDLSFAPLTAIPVTNARPSDALMPIPVREVPGSSYQEEQVIKTDMAAVSGINDAMDPTPGGTASTATEAQLVQAALSKRIELKSRRFEIEVVRGAARIFLYLDQRMIVTPRPPIRQPEDGMTPLEAAQEGRWKWFPIDPGVLMGEFEVIPEGGSMAAENVPQNRQDAVQIMQLFGQNPYVDPVKPLLEAIRLFGQKNPEAWLKQSEPPIPPLTMQYLAQAGVRPELLQHAVATAQRNDPQLAQQMDQATADQQGQQNGGGQ